MSVLALAYRHEDYVEQCLDAIAAQTFDDFELIIVDDHSPDATADRIRTWLGRTGYPAQFVVNEENLGVGAARNRALSLSTGSFVTSAAGDDWYEPTRLEQQVACFASAPEDTAVVFGDLRVVGPTGDTLPPEKQLWTGLAVDDRPIFSRLLETNVVPSPGAMIRRSALEAVGGWDPTTVVDDWDLWLRLADRYRFHHCAGIVANYRELDSGLSRDPIRALERSRSTVELLLRWADRDEATNRAVGRRAWRSALQARSLDRSEGLRLLRRVRDTCPTFARRVGALLAAVPGAGLVLRFVRAARGQVLR